MHRSTLLGGLGGLGGSVSAWLGGRVSAGLGSRRRAGGVRRRRRTVVHDARSCLCSHSGTRRAGGRSGCCNARGTRMHVRCRGRLTTLLCSERTGVLAVHIDVSSTAIRVSSSFAGCCTCCPANLDVLLARYRPLRLETSRHAISSRASLGLRRNDANQAQRRSFDERHEQLAIQRERKLAECRPRKLDGTVGALRSAKTGHRGHARYRYDAYTACGRP